MSKSSMETTYRAIAYTITKTSWIHYILAELGISLHHPVKVLCDNILATCITVNHVLHECSKHIKVDYHFMRERESHGDLIVTYVLTQLQLADIFTKMLPVNRF